MFTRIFYALIVIILGLLHLLWEHSLTGSESLSLMILRRYGGVCGARNFSTSGNMLVFGSNGGYDASRHSLVASLVAMQKPTGSIFMNKWNCTEKIGGVEDDTLHYKGGLFDMVNGEQVLRYWQKKVFPQPEKRICLHFEVYLEGTRSVFGKAEVAKCFTSLTKCSIHFLLPSKEYQSNQVSKAVKVWLVSEMERIFAAEVYRQAKNKEEWSVLSDTVLLIGLGGTSSEMFEQMLFLAERTNLPFDRDAAREIFEKRDANRSKERGLKNLQDHFATQKQASFLIPLVRPCLFSANPLVRKKQLAMEDKEIFPFVTSINDPIAEERGIKYQRYVVQPWTCCSSETVEIGSLVLTSGIDAQSISDCLVTICEELTGRDGAVIPPEVFPRIQFAACRLRCDVRSGSRSGNDKKKDASKIPQNQWRPWGFKILVSCSESQFSDALLIQESLRRYLWEKNIISIKGCKMILLIGDVSLSREHEEEQRLVKQFPWVIFNGTYGTSLTCMLKILEGTGVKLQDIVNISYTASYGQSGVRMMECNNNILVKFNRVGAAIQIAQWWNGLDVTRLISPIGRVMVVYEAALLRNQAQEPRLISPETLPGTVEKSKEVPPVVACVNSMESSGKDKVHKLRSGKTYAQTVSNSKRKAGDMESSSVDFVRLGSCFRDACVRDPMSAMSTVVCEFGKWLGEIPLSHLGEGEEIMEQYKILASAIDVLNGSKFSGALKVISERVNDDSCAMELDSSSNGKGKLVGMIHEEDDFCVGGQEYISHDIERSVSTPSDGACGYASICLILLHATRMSRDLDPCKYSNNMQLLATDLQTVAQFDVIRSSPQLHAKFLLVSAILRLSSWSSILVRNKELWMNTDDITVLLEGYKLSSCEWVWTAGGFKCTANRIKDKSQFCYHVMYYKGHFYLHSRTDASEIPIDFMCHRAAIGLLHGGSIYVTAEEYPEMDRDVKALEALWNENVALRSARMCTIYPALADVPDAVRLQLRRGENFQSSYLAYDNLECVDSELMEFYWEHQDCNRWATVSDHRVFGMTLVAMTARCFIPKGTLIAPVVGTITTEPGSFSAIPCSSVYREFKGTNAHLDPTPVGYDIGYDVFKEPIQVWDAGKLHLNLSRYLRIAWSSALGINTNVEFYYPEGKATIWIRATRNISAHEMLWAVPPSNVRYGMSPVTLYWNPPYPDPQRACVYPEYWEYIVVECLPENPARPLKKQRRLSVNRVTNIFDYSDRGLVTSERWQFYRDSLGELVRVVYISRRAMCCIYKWFGVNIERLLYSFSLFDLEVLRLLLLDLILWTYWFWLDLTKLMERYLRTRYIYLWSPAQSFGVGFSSDNSGDGPKRTYSQAMGECKAAVDDGWLCPLHNIEPIHATNELRIACWNSNGHLVVRDGAAIVDLVEQLQLDVLMLSDCRLTQRAANYHTKTIKNNLRGYAVINLCTSRSSYTRHGGARMNTMGGSMFIFSPRCAAKIIDRGDDGSGLGIAGYVLIIIGDTKFCFISVYQPIGSDNVGESTILARLQSYLHKSKSAEHPKNFVLNTVSRWVSLYRQQGYTIIAGGDFNADPLISSGARFKLWTEENGLMNMLNAAIPHRFFTHMSRGKPVSCIDHIYADIHLFERLLRARVIQRPMLTELSDHCVVYIALSWTNGAQRADLSKRRTISKRIELKHYDEEALERYQEDMRARFHAGNFSDYSATEGLEKLMYESVESAQELCDRVRYLSQKVGFRSKFKDGYSPIFCALKSAYELILNYQQRLSRLQYHHFQQKALLHSKFIKSSRDWLRKYPFNAFSHDEVLSRAHDLAYSTLSDIRLLQNITPEDLFSRALIVRRRMHGRLRTEYRRRMAEKIKKMEDLRQQHRLGQIFQMVNLKEKQSIDLSVITNNGSTIMDPVMIHEELTKHFSLWYKVPIEIHFVAMNIQNNNLWEDLLCGGEIQAIFPDSFRIREFSRACKYKASASQREYIYKMMMQPITDAEYSMEVAQMKYGKAPGPTGATATMIKAWPCEVHEQVLCWINELWSQKCVPKWWLRGHLRPIPKTGEISLENLRPLGLYEISRKILTAIITHRMYNLWEELGLLDNRQHAFRRRNGTSQAIIRILNVIEDANERGVPMRMVTWDFRRAFDSVSFNFIRLALLRLGVPREIVEFLLYLIENNDMTVASPHHMSRHFENIRTGCNDAAFHQERGTGQGDPPSPYIWLALFDVLITMLGEDLDLGMFFAQGISSRVYPVRDVAYADDLVTVSSSLRLHQEKADLVCTFCACTGMQVAINKVRSFAVNCRESCSNLVLRDAHWNAHILTAYTEKVAFKYLGLLTDHVSGDVTAFEAVIQYLQAASSHLIHCHASREVKLLVYRMQIVPRVLYVSAKTCWTIEQCRQLDRYAAAILKHIGQQLATSANSMMFFPSHLCGMGLHPLSDLTQSQKWGDLIRTMDTPGDASLAANGLLERALRQTAQQGPSTQFRVINNRYISHLKCYVGSLVEWGSEVGFFLANKPCFEYSDSNKAILPYLEDGEESDDLILQLQRKDITVQGELVRYSHSGECRWETDPTTMLMRKLLREHLIDFPSDVNLLINNGQMYDMNGSVYEVIGVVQDTSDILCYVWRYSHDESNVIFRSTQHEIAIEMVPESYLSKDDISRIITCPVRNVSKQVGVVRRRVVSSTICAVPMLGKVQAFVPPAYIKDFAADISVAIELYQCPYALFTDGSQVTSQIFIQDILASYHQDGLRQTTAAIVAIANTENWRDYPCYVLHCDMGDDIIDGARAYHAELLALVVAVHVQSIVTDIPIYSDCQGAIKTLEASFLGKKRANKGRVRPCIGTLQQISSLPLINWIKAHPERYMQRSNWSPHDWGIFLADCAAGGQIDVIKQYTAVKTVSVLLTDIARDFVMPGTWFWSRDGSDIPSAETPLRLQSELRVQAYLEKRDSYRAMRGEEAFWSDTYLGLANHCWKSLVKNILGCNTVLKNVLDKYWHGRNRAKGLSGIAADAALRCLFCGAADSQLHIFLECEMPELVVLRMHAFDRMHLIYEMLTRDLDGVNLYERRVLAFIVNHAFKKEYKDVCRIWLGTWTMAMLQSALTFEAESDCHPLLIQFEDAMQIKQSIVTITEILVKTVADMMRTRNMANALLYKEERSSKRRRVQQTSEEVPVVSSSSQSKSDKGKNVLKVKTKHGSQNERVYTRRKKKCSINRDEDHQDNSIPMDIVGYVSHPWGETQSCDYDKD